GMVTGTWLVVREGFSSIVPLGPGGGPLEIYAGVAALVLNLTVAVACTAALHRLGVPRGADATDLPSRLMVRRRPETGANNPCDADSSPRALCRPPRRRPPRHHPRRRSAPNRSPRPSPTPPTSNGRP